MTTTTIFHGSFDKNLTNIKDEGVFGGLFFASSESAALGHGDYLYKTTLKLSDIANDQDLEQATGDQFRELFKWMSDQDFAVYNDLLRDLVIYDTSVSSLDEPELALAALSESEIFEADWFAQKLRGALASKLGFKAVEMCDEHGTSYLVLPSVTIENAE